MGRIVAAEYLSLDGVTEDPGPAGEYDHVLASATCGRYQRWTSPHSRTVAPLPAKPLSLAGVHRSILWALTSQNSQRRCDFYRPRNSPRFNPPSEKGCNAAITGL